MKRCTKCGVPKPLEDFAKNSRTKDGRKPACKACHRAAWHQDGERNRARKKAHYEANRETINVSRRAERAADPEAARESARAYYTANGERVRANNKRSRDRHKDRIKQANQHYYAKNRAAILRQKHGYWEANKETLKPKNRARWAKNRVRYSETAKLWREANRESLLAYFRQRGADHRAFTDSLKDCPCLDCGGSFPPYVMEFDHVRGAKRFAIGKMANHSRAAIEVELDKCELVCCVCHRIRSHERRERPTTRGVSEFHAWLRPLKTQPCRDCGGVFPPEAMDFDHVRGVKNVGIAQMWSWGRDKVLAEVAKCDLVCANCHRVRHTADANEEQAA